MTQRPVKDVDLGEPTTPDAGIIRVMPDILANKIAAGEVVGRPSSVVKELVENALDAGASHVDIVLTDSGRTLIQVSDDGSGMSAADAQLAFERHATSKIRDIGDLERIHTLGFRGEALASIASVARVELRTRRFTDDLGCRIVIEGGEHSVTEPCGTPAGTSLAVRQLFYNVPARRAFLKTDATELSHMVEIAQILAISHPAVGFSLTHNANELIRLAPIKGDRQSAVAGRIGDMFGHPDSSLFPVDEQTSYLAVRGWVGQPEIRRKSRGEQFLFVNGRAIRSRYLEHAVYASFRGLIPEGTYPFFVLHLDVDTRHVDVNVHPAKSEVKFDDERGVYAMLRAVVGKALSEGAGVLRMEDGVGMDLLGAASGDGGAQRPPGSRDTSGLSPGEITEALYAPNSIPGIASASTGGGPDEDARPESLVWQILGSYILAPIRSGLLVVDQHAAHERVIYERSLKALDDGFGLSQQLLFPTNVELNASEFALLEGLLPDLRAIGFDIAPMSGRTVMVRGVPTDIRTGDERAVLNEVLDQYREFAQRMRLSSRELLARSLAQRSAIPSDSRLDAREMRSLIDQLFQCKEPYTNPGGRPTLIRITADELSRRFGAR